MNESVSFIKELQIVEVYFNLTLSHLIQWNSTLWGSFLKQAHKLDFPFISSSISTYTLPLHCKNKNWFNFLHSIYLIEEQKICKKKMFSPVCWKVIKTTTKRKKINIKVYKKRSPLSLFINTSVWDLFALFLFQTQYRTVLCL